MKASLLVKVSASRTLLVLAALAVLQAPVSWATAIIVISTSDGFWVGADSRRSLDNEKPIDVCKVHETKFGLIGKAGAITGFTMDGRYYSLDSELQEEIESASSVAQFHDSFMQRQVEDIWQQIAYLLHSPSLLYMTLLPRKVFSSPMPNATRDDQLRDTFTIALEGDQLQFKQLMIFPDSEKYQGGYRYKVSSDWMMLDSKMLRDNYDARHRSLHQLGTWVKYEKDDDWITRNPETALREILAISHEKYPDSVSDTFSIVHLYLTHPKKSDSQHSVLIKYDWVEKGMCPSWDIAIHRVPSLTVR